MSYEERFAYDPRDERSIVRERNARLAPEQVEHEHPAESLRYDAKRDVFICSGDEGCGAELVMPEMSHAIRLSVATE